MNSDGFWRQVAGGVELFVRLTPKSSRDAVEGIGIAADGRSHLKARVRAVPEDGKANKALVKLIGKTTGLPSGSIEIAAGHTSRLKTIRITGEMADIKTRLAGIAEPSPDRG